MAIEVSRVGFPIALNVGKTIRLRGIGPPVVSVGIVIMDPSRAQCGKGLRDAHRRKIEHPVCLTQDPLAINGRNTFRRPYFRGILFPLPK